MRWQAVIFDLDGVLCSTDEYHYRAWKALANKLGLPFSREKNHRLRGVSRVESLEIVLEDYPRAFSPQEKAALAAEKNTAYRALLLQLGPADLAPGARHTLDALRSMGLALAVGSSSKNTPLILHQLGLEGYFDAVVDGNGITNSKPDPEVFLKAAALLGVAPASCLVVEDAAAGVAAARAGGMMAAYMGDVALKPEGCYPLGSLADLPGLVAGHA